MNETKKDTDKKVVQEPASQQSDIEPPQTISKDCIEVLNAAAYYETRKAYPVKGFATPEGEKWPTAELTTPNKKLKAYAQLRPDPEEVEPYLSEEQLAQWQKRVAEFVMNMNDLTADVMDIISAIWLRKAQHYEAMVTVKADDFLQLRGLLPQKSGTGRRGGYKNEWRQEIARHIAILGNTWVTIVEMEVIDLVEGKKSPYRKRTTWRGESKAVVVEARFGKVNEEGELDTYSWRVRPGYVFAKFLFGPGRQTALLAQRALEYDPYRQKWEKRLTRYFAYQWRIRQGSGNYLGPFRVEALLKAVGEEVDKEHPNRTKDRFEQAMDTLKEDKVIGGWQYDPLFPEEVVGKKDWCQEVWLVWKVLVEPPQEIMDQYAKIKNPEKKKVKVLPCRETLPCGKLEVGKKLRQVRLEMGLTQMQAAEQIGIHQSRIARIERGEKPSPETLARIEKWLAKEQA